MASINFPSCCNFEIVECLRLFEQDIRSIVCPKRNKKKLKRKMVDLKDIREKVTGREKQQELQQPGTESKDTVDNWLRRVIITETHTSELLDSLAKRSSSVCCCFSPNIGKHVEDLIAEIESLVSEGRGYLHDEMGLVQPNPIKPIDNVPDLATPMVGRDSKLSEIHGYIKDSQVQIVGILGPGGIGKTTLLKSIKDELRSKHPELFFYIIWIEMSSQTTVDILDIQKQIAECISLSFQSEDETGRANELRNVLKPKKSLVLIDNVWNELDFERIGIPSGVGIDNVKIVFTTGSESVCNDMSAQKILKLGCLDEAESLQLFQNHISSDHVDLKNQIVRQRVDEILKKCGGLPLAIITIASVVKYYTDVAQWDDAVDCLQNSPEDIEGMNDVMRCLKFSYDNLESNEIRSCLLYFSLYPQGSNISTEKLIKEWIGEGFLDISNKNSFKKSYAKGIGFVNKLKSICLVESGFLDDRVKVHDLIRDMLCWICKNERKEVFLVYDEDHDNVISNDYNDWNLVKGMFVNERQLNRSPHQNGMSLCPDLTSVIVQKNPNYSFIILKLPTDDFFYLTPSLRVLDLSFIELVELPKSIGELGELRHLNLNSTFIKMLPVELRNLKKLKFLDLGNTWKLESIPNVAIFQLSMLQSLNLFNTKYQWNSDVSVPLLMLEGLRELKNLEDLGVDVSSNSHLNTILGNQILFNSITRIRFKKIDFVEEDQLQPLKVIFERFPQLKKLTVDGCVLLDNVLQIKDSHRLVIEILQLWNLDISSVVIAKDCTFHSLEGLRISNCPCLKEVSWTTQLPSLQWLTVEKCNGLEELVATGEEEEEEIEEERDSYFPKLLFLHIKDMENLHSIYGGRENRPLLFPKLKELSIQNCPKLKRLSLGRDSAKGIQVIKCTQSQWNLFKWEDDQVRAKFLPYLRVPLQ